MEQFLVRKQISNHPIVSNISRYVVIKGLYIDVEEPRLELLYKVQYFDGEQDVSSSFLQTGGRWIVDNNYRVNVLDENGEPIPNPDYEEGGDEEEYLMENAFDYFLQISFNAEQPIRIKDLMEFYIDRDDLVKGRFNF